MCHAHRARWRPPFVHAPFHRHAPHDQPDAGWGGFASMSPGDDPSGGGFGVRRPLRFLAHKLDLTDDQVTRLARVLDALKTERAQSAVDDRRTLADFADALSGEAFDQARAATGADRRTAAAQRLRDALLSALGQIHALLTPEQRQRLAYLIRTGTLVL